MSTPSREPTADRPESDEPSNDNSDGFTSANRLEKTEPAPAETMEIPPSGKSACVDFLIRCRNPLLISALVLLGLSWWHSQQLTFNRSIESLYAADDPRLVNFIESKRFFGGDEFAVVAWTDRDLLNEWTHRLNADSRERIVALRNALNQVDGINPASTQDLAAAHTPKSINIDLPTFLPDFVKSKIERILTNMSIPPKALHRMLRGVLIGYDNQTTAVVLRFLPENESPVSRGETIQQIRRAAEKFGEEHGVHAFVVGEPVQVHEMFRYVEEDGDKLFGVSLLLLAVVLLLLLRDLRWVLLPLLLVLMAIIWTEAILVISKAQLSMVSSMLNSLVTIIGVATAVHLAVHYRDRRRTHMPREALRHTLMDLLPAICWTVLTTAVGFAALISSRITPVRSFGLMMAMATILVLLAVVSVIPGGVLLGQKERLRPRGSSFLSAGLSNTSGWLNRNGALVLSVFFVIFVFAAAGLWRLEIETDFSKNFRDDSDIVQALEFAEKPEHLAAAGTWDLNFTAPVPLTNEYLADVKELARRLRAEFSVLDEKGIDTGRGRIANVFSLTDAIDDIKKVPYISSTLEKRLDILQRMQPEFLETFYSAKDARMRIMLRARERVRAEVKLQLIADVEAVAETWRQERLAKTLPDTSVDVKATGLYVLLAFLTGSLLEDQMISFALAAAGIGLMIMLAFRSVRIALVALLPNVFPIVLVIGGMGWTGLPVNIATAMIASVSMGLTVDSSVHYISGYLRARKSGADHAAALAQTHGQVGRALVMANIALIAGFSVLMLSDFIPLIYFAALVNVAMLGGLAGNLLLLPVLLGWATRSVTPTSASAEVATH